MDCATCFNSRLSPFETRQHSGFYVCRNEHFQCNHCNESSMGKCGICQQITRFVYIHWQFADATHSQTSLANTKDTVASIEEPKSIFFYKKQCNQDYWWMNKRTFDATTASESFELAQQAKREEQQQQHLRNDAPSPQSFIRQRSQSLEQRNKPISDGSQRCLNASYPTEQARPGYFMKSPLKAVKHNLYTNRRGLCWDYTATKQPQKFGVPNYPKKSCKPPELNLFDSRAAMQKSAVSRNSQMSFLLCPELDLATSSLEICALAPTKQLQKSTAPALDVTYSKWGRYLERRTSAQRSQSARERNHRAPEELMEERRLANKKDSDSREEPRSIFDKRTFNHDSWWLNHRNFDPITESKIFELAMQEALENQQQFENLTTAPHLGDNTLRSPSVERYVKSTNDDWRRCLGRRAGEKRSRSAGEHSQRTMDGGIENHTPQIERAQRGWNQKMNISIVPKPMVEERRLANMEDSDSREVPRSIAYNHDSWWMNTRTFDSITDNELFEVAMQEALGNHQQQQLENLTAAVQGGARLRSLSLERYVKSNKDDWKRSGNSFRRSTEQPQNSDVGNYSRQSSCKRPELDLSISSGDPKPQLVKSTVPSYAQKSSLKSSFSNQETRSRAHRSPLPEEGHKYAEDTWDRCVEVELLVDRAQSEDTNSSIPEMHITTAPCLSKTSSKCVELGMSDSNSLETRLPLAGQQLHSAAVKCTQLDLPNCNILGPLQQGSKAAIDLAGQELSEARPAVPETDCSAGDSTLDSQSGKRNSHLWNHYVAQPFLYCMHRPFKVLESEPLRVFMAHSETHAGFWVSLVRRACCVPWHHLRHQPLPLQSQLIECPAEFVDALLVRKTDLNAQLPVLPASAMQLCITRAPSRCPELYCGEYVNMSNFILHLMAEHKKLTVSHIRSGGCIAFYLDLQLTDYNRAKCHTLLLLQHTIKELGCGEHNHLLPVLIMSMRVHLYDLFKQRGDRTLDELRQEHEDCQLTLIWASTYTSRVLPMTANMTVWSQHGNAPDCHFAYTGKLYNLRHTNRPMKLLQSGCCIILTPKQVAALTENGMGMLGMQFSIVTRY